MKNETELLEKIRNGSTDDFGELIQQHQSLVFSILFRYERDKHLLEDLAQETFIKAWKALHQFDGRAPFSHWLSRIAVHVALDHLRKRKRVQNETAIEDLGEDALEWFYGEDNADLEGNQAREILDLAMQKLSADERLVITLQEIEGKSATEIGALTGWSNVGVRVRAFRARKKLRNALLAMENRKTGETKS
ncbi:MAG: sigma-70 family RNA polymerase sigma factor [Verrucomicrobia bacterium]|nr:sigma-70 family RNA polymerase sigma factor [Verrucomicrobiota bacterium]